MLLQLSSERCGDALTAMMELMQIDHVVICDLCGADCSSGWLHSWPALIPTTALKYAVTSCASSWLSLSHYLLEFTNSLQISSQRSYFHTDLNPHSWEREKLYFFIKNFSFFIRKKSRFWVTEWGSGRWFWQILIEKFYCLSEVKCFCCSCRKQKKKWNEQNN